MRKWVLLFTSLALFSLMACTNQNEESQQELKRRGGSMYQNDNNNPDMGNPDRVANEENKENTQQELDRREGSLYQDGQNGANPGYAGRNPDTERNDRMQGNGQNEIGYYHVDQVSNQHSGMFIDRSVLAKHIAQLVANLPQANQPTTLVTDDHVFIGLQYKPAKKGQKSMSHEELKAEAQRVAESATPRFFKIHVTDRAELENKINKIGMRMQGNGDIEGIHGDLNQLLEQMGDATHPG